MGRRRGSMRGGFEPATISLAVLSAVTGVSGYGASVVNKDQQAMIDQKVAQEVEAIRGSVNELETIKSKLSTETTEKERLRTEVDSLKAAIEQLKLEKTSKEGKLKSVQLDDLAFRSATRAQLLKTLELVKQSLPASETLDEAMKEYTANVSSLLKRRDTLDAVVTKLAGITGKSVEELRGLFMDALRRAPEEVKKDILEAAEAKKAEAEQKKRDLEEAKKAEAERRATPPPAPIPVPVPEPTPEPTPSTQQSAPEPIPEPIPEPMPTSQQSAPIPEPIPVPEDEDEARPWEDSPEEKIQRDAECKTVLDGLEIKSKRDFIKWARLNHPDKGGDTALFQRVNECALRIFSRGGLRKKKLRTRRRDKQNVRRSRNRKNRANRTN